ncbi:MAG: hypothetical protein RW306_08310 [Geobacteraceae bacterium]|nr:hypothetical protein [Geobacteraceae bacterium]
MNKSFLVRLAILLVAITTLSGCLLVPVDDGFRDGDSRHRDRGEHRGDRHDRH